MVTDLYSSWQEHKNQQDVVVSYQVGVYVQGLIGPVVVLQLRIIF